MRILVLATLLGLISCGQNPEENNAQTAEFSGQYNIPEHEEDWGFYLGLIDYKFSSTFLDLGYMEIAPVNGFDQHGHISFKLNKPNPSNNMSISEELPRLIEIEEFFEKNLIKDDLSIYIGRYTTDGYRDLCFFTQDTVEFLNRIPGLITEFPDYNFGFAVQYDPDWEVYTDFLFPSPKQMQTIQNRRGLEQLEKNGDALVKARPVDHWIYFNSEVGRTQFVEEIKISKFEIVEEWFENEYDKEFPYAIQIMRIDKVGYDDIDNVTLPLFELANEYNGIYDGWETSIEK